MDPYLLSPALAGFALGATLIIAIGAQNAFVLRQGLVREHVFAVVAVCSLSDALLIAAGVAGLGSLVGAHPALLTGVTLGGAAFLVVYGMLALKRAIRPGVLAGAPGTGSPLAATLATCLLLTFANPHVYLDTVVLLGGLSARYEGAARIAYGLGAASSSLVWFTVLGYGARLLAPLFARPMAWRVLDLCIVAIMWLLAARLLADFS